MQDVYTCAANLEYADLLLLFVFLQPNMRAFAESVKNQPVSGLFRERRICYNGEEIKEGKAGMKQICFTAEWGTWTGYFAEKYLARYDFSGHLETEGGTVLRVERIFYPKDAWGPFIFSKQFIEYGKTEWESHLCNCFDGIRVTAEADGKTVFRIVTKMGTAEFTPDTLQKNGHLVFHVGEKYSMAIIHIEPAEPAWRAAPLLPGEVRVPGSAFSGRQADFFGVRGVAVFPHVFPAGAVRDGPYFRPVLFALSYFRKPGKRKKGPRSAEFPFEGQWKRNLPECNVYDLS